MPTVVALLMTILLLAIMPADPIIAGDTPTYLDFAPVRTAGYPLFLDLFGSWTPVAQLILFGISAATLGEAIRRRTAAQWPGALAVIGVFINPEVAALHWTLLTDSLSLSFLALVLACCLERRWLAVGIFAGLAAAVRPSAYPLLALLVLLPLPNRRSALTSSLAFLAIVGAERAYSFSVHGDALTSLTGRHLYAKAALIDGAGGTAPLDRALEMDFAPVRHLVSKAEGMPAQDALIADYEVCIQWSCSAHLPVVGRGEAGLRRIASNPLGYLSLALEEYRGLWVFGSRTHPSLAPQYDRFIQANRPLPFEAQIARSGVLRPTEPRRAAYFVRPAFIFLGFLMAMVTVWAIVRRDKDLLAPGLAIQLLLLFTAATAVGYGRYTMLIWPAIITVLALLAARLVAWAVPMVHARPQSTHAPASSRGGH